MGKLPSASLNEDDRLYAGSPWETRKPRKMLRELGRGRGEVEEFLLIQIYVCAASYCLTIMERIKNAAWAYRKLEEQKHGMLIRQHIMGVR